MEQFKKKSVKGTKVITSFSMNPVMSEIAETGLAPSPQNISNLYLWFKPENLSSPIAPNYEWIDSIKNMVLTGSYNTGTGI